MIHRPNYLGFHIIVFSVMILMAAACSSPKKAYNRGDYDKAVTMSIDKLRSKPGNRTAREVLAKAWPRSIAFHESQILMYRSSADRFKWERVVTSYEQLNRLSTLAQRCPACDDLVDTRRLFIDELNDARASAAEARYLAGIDAMGTRTRENAREAVEHFMVVERMVPDYRDTRSRMEEAMSQATIHVLVHVTPVPSRSLSVSHEFFHNKIMQYLASGPMEREFVRFYYPHEADRAGMEQPDHEIWLQFDEFVVGQTSMATNTETFTSKDSVKVGETKLPSGETIDVFNTVQARYTRHTKTVISGGLLDMQILDSRTERVILQEKIPGEFIWINEWATFNGDERALTSRQRELARLKEEPVPTSQDLFIAFTGPIYDQVTNRLRRFYAGL